MSESGTLKISSNYKNYELDITSIQYVNMNENVAEIHLSGGRIYKTRISMKKLENELGGDFIKVHRSCLVSVMAIHDITDKVVLNNGERLNYVARRKKDLITELQEKRKHILDRFSAQRLEHTEEDYHERFRSFDDLPIAFCDIEMVLDESNNAVDWIFRYGNEALARLEKTPLDKLIGRRFSEVFHNMDGKWLKSYERAALFGQTLEIIDYSPEIDTDLDIICFPTVKGHCGCILLDVDRMYYAENRGDRQNARLRYLRKILGQF